ncbi:MAG TPA: hypothetical protein VIZ65_17500 [Cellvibrionaceae bacterium]
MSDSVRLVNQQLAFSQSHLDAARLNEGFLKRCQLQACKLQMHLLMHAYLAEIAERHGLKWKLNPGELNLALSFFQQQLQQQEKISSDFEHLAELIQHQNPWHYWKDLSSSSLFIGKNELFSPVLNDTGAIDSTKNGPIIISSQTPENPLNADTNTQLELLHQLLTALNALIQMQRQNKIEF